MHVFFYISAWCSPAAKNLFVALSALGRARGPSAHYDACLDPSRAQWRRSEHSNSLNWLFLSRGRPPGDEHGKPYICLVFLNSPLPSHMDYAKKLKLRFRVEDLDLHVPERRKRCTSSHQQPSDEIHRDLPSIARNHTPQELTTADTTLDHSASGHTRARKKKEMYQ